MVGVGLPPGDAPGTLVEPALRPVRCDRLEGRALSGPRQEDGVQTLGEVAVGADLHHAFVGLLLLSGQIAGKLDADGSLARDAGHDLCLSRFRNCCQPIKVAAAHGVANTTTSPCAAAAATLPA